MPTLSFRGAWRRGICFTQNSGNSRFLALLGMTSFQKFVLIRVDPWPAFGVKIPSGHPPTAHTSPAEACRSGADTLPTARDDAPDGSKTSAGMQENVSR